MKNTIHWLHRIYLMALRFATWLGELGIPHFHRLGLLPGDDRVRVIADNRYGWKSGKQGVDVYLPRNPPGNGAPLPFLFYMHGGGWVSGGRKLSAITGRKLAARGIAVISVGYRLSPEFTPNEQLEDLHAALRLVRERAGEWGLDPDRYAFAGESAGAHLSVRFAQEIAEDLPAPQAVVAKYGVFDFLRWAQTNWFTRHIASPFVFDCIRGVESPESGARAVSAIQPLRSCETRVLLIHGSSDSVTPWDQSEQLAAYLKEQGSAVILKTYPWMEHAFTYIPFDWVDGVREAYELMNDFLQRELMEPRKKAA
ncbi:MAG: alpha/beta hydrolase [Chrysiogenetes bacterium]|nr:alpha/beta hydrolase [Chrysiogenetes bacterium]